MIPQEFDMPSPQEVAQIFSSFQCEAAIAEEKWEQKKKEVVKLCNVLACAVEELDSDPSVGLGPCDQIQHDIDAAKAVEAELKVEAARRARIAEAAAAWYFCSLKAARYHDVEIY